MDIVIKEDEHFPISEDNPEVIPYAGAAITIYERKKKIRIEMIDKDAFDTFFIRIKRIYFSLVARDPDSDRITFKTTHDIKNNCFYFRRDNDEALRFLRSSKVISETTYQKALAVTKLLGVSNNAIQKSDLNQNSQRIAEVDEISEYNFEEKEQEQEQEQDDQNSIESKSSTASIKSSVVIPSSFFPNMQNNKISDDRLTKKLLILDKSPSPVSYKN
jgi:hypothetical protein